MLNDKDYKLGIFTMPSVNSDDYKPGGVMYKYMKYSNPTQNSESFLEAIQNIVLACPRYKNRTDGLRKISVGGARSVIEYAKIFGMKFVNDLIHNGTLRKIRIFSDKATVSELTGRPEGYPIAVIQIKKIK